MRKRVSGVYGIKNIITGKMYIGRSINIYDRFRHHRNNLRGNKHHSHYLQNSFNKYGERVFIYGIIEECNNEDTYTKEKYYITKYDSFEEGYNECIPTGNREGRIFTDEDKAKHSIAIQKHRTKASKEFWRKNAEGLAKGRKQRDVNVAITFYLYNKVTFKLERIIISHLEMSKFFKVTKKRFETVCRRIKIGRHWSYKGYIIVRGDEVAEEVINKYKDHFKL